MTKLDRQRNDDILEELGVTYILTETCQACLQWYGHLWRMKIEGEMNGEHEGGYGTGRIER